jgi:hypothetical protein
LRLSRQARIEEALVRFEASESAVAVVGMPGFRLLAAVEVDGELHQLVETTAAVVGCSGCGTRAMSKGRRDVHVRDLPAAPTPTARWAAGANGRRPSPPGRR